MLLGLDTAVIAGTGAGKMMLFVMPLLLDKAAKSMVIIISPLNELEQDQVCIVHALTMRCNQSNLWQLARLGDS